MENNADDEAPKDPGAQKVNHQSYTEKDFEGQSLFYQIFHVLVKGKSWVNCNL